MRWGFFIHKFFIGTSFPSRPSFYDHGQCACMTVKVNTIAVCPSLTYKWNSHLIINVGIQCIWSRKMIMNSNENVTYSQKLHNIKKKITITLLLYFLINIKLLHIFFFYVLIQMYFTALRTDFIVTTNKQNSAQECC